MADQFRIGQVVLPHANCEVCRRCVNGRLLPRNHFEGVLWCVGCGAQFDELTGREIEPIDGPRLVSAGASDVPYLNDLASAAQRTRRAQR